MTAEKKNAVSNKEKLTKYMEQEVAIEGIISSKNLPDAWLSSPTDRNRYGG